MVTWLLLESRILVSKRVALTGHCRPRRINAQRFWLLPLLKSRQLVFKGKPLFRKIAFHWSSWRRALQIRRFTDLALLTARLDFKLGLRKLRYRSLARIQLCIHFFRGKPVRLPLVSLLQLHSLDVVLLLELQRLRGCSISLVNCLLAMLASFS